MTQSTKPSVGSRPSENAQPAAAAASVPGKPPPARPIQPAKAAAPSAPRLPTMKAAWWRLLTVEHGLLAAGIAAAATSGSFGLYMNLRDHGEPDIKATQYLTVFAQMMHGRDAPRPSEDESRIARFKDVKIDPVITGSIPATRTQSASSDPVEKSGGELAPLQGYVVRDVFEDMALIESPYGLTLAKPGSTLLGAGIVLAIELRDGKWVAVTSQGVIGSAAK